MCEQCISESFCGCDSVVDVCVAASSERFAPSKGVDDETSFSSVDVAVSSRGEVLSDVLCIFSPSDYAEVIPTVVSPVAVDVIAFEALGNIENEPVQEYASPSVEVSSCVSGGSRTPTSSRHPLHILRGDSGEATSVPVFVQKFHAVGDSVVEHAADASEARMLEASEPALLVMRRAEKTGVDRARASKVRALKGTRHWRGAESPQNTSARPLFVMLLTQPVGGVCSTAAGKGTYSFHARSMALGRSDVKS